MRGACGVLALVVPAVASGCATVGARSPMDVPVVGRAVTVAMEGGHKVKGELLAVDEGRVFIGADDGVREVPLASVREVRVKRHGFGARKALTWALVGGLATGGTLAASCASVEDAGGCMTIGAVTLGAWMAVGGLAAPAAEASSRIRLRQPDAGDLRPFARLPQGLPDGVSPALLGPPPPPDARKRRR
jgi:hypothetical protein